jgi:hypothetical protein
MLDRTNRIAEAVGGKLAVAVALSRRRPTPTDAHRTTRPGAAL